MNFISDNNDPMDDYGHGTHVAGIIGAAGNNGRGVSGISWNARIMPLKFISSEGYGVVSDGIEAIDYAVRNGARVINASFGSYNSSLSERLAIDAARQAGVLFVAASGNNGSDNDTAPFYPASYDLDNIISVAASDANDSLAPISNYGRSSVHIAAPGGMVLSTIPGGYAYDTGTSMAAPMVSGAASLLLSHDPSLTYLQAKGRILGSADQISLPIVTSGRLNAYRALAGGGEILVPPSGLKAQASALDIRLTWADNSTTETGFKVERRGGPPRLLR